MGYSANSCSEAARVVGADNMESQGSPPRGGDARGSVATGHSVRLWLGWKSVLAVGDKAESGEVEKGHFIEVLVTELWA